MNENLIHSISEVTDANTARIAKLEEEIADLKKALQQMTDWSVAVERLSKSNSNVNLLNAQIAGLTRDSQSLRKELQETHVLFTKPQEHRHSHYFPKIAWITAGLFVAMCLMATGWFITSSRLKTYRANDLKYRYLQLVEQAAVAQAVRYVDSLQRAKPDFFRDSVLTEENEKQLRLEFLDEAVQKEKEARQLRQKANSK